MRGGPSALRGPITTEVEACAGRFGSRGARSPTLDSTSSEASLKVQSSSACGGCCRKSCASEVEAQPRDVRSSAAFSLRCRLRHDAYARSARFDRHYLLERGALSRA